MKHLQQIILMTLLSAVWASSYAASGASPNGKPFVALQGEILEIKGVLRSYDERIDGLIIRTTVLEDDIRNSEHAITHLVQLNDALNYQVATTSGDLELLTATVGELEMELEAANDKISVLGQTDEMLTSEIFFLSELIAGLEEAMYFGHITLESQIALNESLINSLSSRIELAEAHLELKQAVLNQSCPEGEFLYAVQPDGMVACAAPEAADELNFVTVYSGGTYAKCPSDSRAMSGGYSFGVRGNNNDSMVVRGMRIIDNGWKIYIYNDGFQIGSYVTFVQCLI